MDGSRRKDELTGVMKEFRGGGGADRGTGVFLTEGLLSAACSLKNGAKGAETVAVSAFEGRLDDL